jgi:multidrug efflux system membrane fusion protein
MSTNLLPVSSPARTRHHACAGKIRIGLVVVLALFTAGAFWWVRAHKGPADKNAGSAKRGELPPVPVVDGVVAEKDVPIYLDGLGTVQAFNTVTVRARVDGQVERILFNEGQDVHVGDVLVQIDPAPFQAALDQAVAKKGQDEAQLANAQVDLKRYADLLADEGVTQQVYDTQKALVNQLEAAVKADQAAIESARVQLAYTTITSPIDGRTGIRQVDQGNLVHASDSNGLVVITQLKPIYVVFTLPEQYLGRIHQQLSETPNLTILAVGRDNTNVISEGMLSVIDNQIDTSTGTIKLKATFPNENLSLWPGQFVNARLRLSIRKDSAVVPASVVQRGPEGAFAFVIKDDQTVEIRPIRVAQIEQGEALIEAGLRPGERVVVDGQYKLQKGSRISTTDSRAAVAAGDQGGGPSKRVSAGKATGASNYGNARP